MRVWLWHGNDEGNETIRTAALTAYSAPVNNFITVNLLLVTLITKAECAAIFFSQDAVLMNDIIQLMLSGRLTCRSLNSLICASEASNSFLLLDLAVPETECFGGFSEDFWELVKDEVKPKGFGEVDSGRVEQGGEGTERGLGEEQRERGRC